MSDNTRYQGPSVIGLLGVAFVVLKLTHVINWSWWLVTLPFWGGLALFFAVLLFLAIAGSLAVIGSAAADRLWK